MNNSNYITFFDLLLAFFYLLVIYVIASHIKNKNIKANPIYKYFLWGLFAKIFGAISCCLIYVYYYDGGDTTAYHDDGVVMVNLLLHSPLYFFKVLFSPFQKEYLSYFTNETGYVEYWQSVAAFNTVRFITLLEIIGMKSYLISSILMAVLSFTGVWKLYLTFCECYPKLNQQFAVSILFIPSVAFWGSGLLKDSLTLAATGWYVYSFYRIFINKHKMTFYIITIIMSIFVMILIKPYIFIGLLPGSILWMIWSRLLKIKNIMLRFLVAPLIAGGGILLGILLWSATSSNFGQYTNIDSMVQKAYISYTDLKQEYYHGNSFTLGDYDPTLFGMLSKFPEAVNAGLFRPYIWEAKNPVMIISGLENLIFLSLTLFFLIRRPVSFITSLFTNPLVLFSIIFGVFFAFSVGISTPNFGALVRLRIPALPFFISGIILIEYLSKQKNEAKK